MAATALREILAKFGFEFPDNKKLDDTKSKVNAFAKNLTELSEKVLGGPLKGAMKDMIGDVKDSIGEFKTAALQLGISNQELQRWQFAAKGSGVEVTALNTGFRLLQKTAAAAAAGTKDAGQDMADGTLEMVLAGDKAQKLFKGLGISVTDGTGKIKDTPALMREVGAAIAGIPDPSQRTAVALQVFGRQGAALIPLFNKGEKGLNELIKRFDELGGGVSDEAIAAVAANSKASREFDLAMLSLKSTMVTIVAPVFTEGTKLWTDLVAWVNKATKGTEVFRSGLIVLVGALVIFKAEAIAAGIKTALAWAPTLLIFAALVLILDDLITFAKGGESATGKLLELLFGKEAGQSIAKQMQGDLADLSKRIDKAPSMGDKIEEVFSTIGASIVKFFVDDIPEFVRRVFGDLTGYTTDFGKGWEDLFDDIFGSILAMATDWVLDLVRSIVDGIANGLRDKWEKVSETFKDLAKGLIQTFKDTFMIRSPSQVLYKLTGYLPEGSIRALVEATPRLRAQAADTFGAMVPSPATFAPVIRVPTVNAPGVSGSFQRSAHVQSQVSVTVKDGTPRGYRDAVREGLGLGFQDQNKALIATLEPSVDEEG